MGSRQGGQLLLAAAALVLAVWGLGEWTRPVPPGPAGAIPGVPSEESTTPLTPQARKRLALAKAQQRELLARGESILRKLAGIDEAIAAWDVQVTSLLSSAVGRQLAQREDQVRKVAGLFAEPRWETGEVAEARRRVEALLAPLRAALADPGASAMPPATLTEHLQREQDGADDGLRAHEERRARLQVMLTFAALSAPGPKTLAQALREVQGQEP